VTSTVISQAEFSTDKNNTHRYTLKKVWNQEGEIAVVIMLNPTKKADAIRFDKSVMLMNNYFAEQINNNNEQLFGGFIVINLFSYRSATLAELKNIKLKNRSDVNTDKWIEEAIKNSNGYVYIAWGSNNNRKTRVKKVVEYLKKYKITEVYKLKKHNNKHVHPSRYPGKLEFIKILVKNII
jgi:hypothetical protein